MDTYNLLVQRIANSMKSMSEDEALSLALKITESINLFLAGQCINNEDKYVSELIPNSVRSHAILSVGWDAHRIFKNEYDISKSRLSFLSTMPSSYRLTENVTQLRSDSGIWAGSLLTSISEIINSATKELFIIAPYWSTSGVRSLLNNLDSYPKQNLCVYILTQPKSNLRVDEQNAVEEIRDFFSRNDANVGVYSPALEANKAPLLHAKAVIADCKHAYIGSANYTASGVEHSIEIGVKIEGMEVKLLTTWALFLKDNFDEWC